VRAPDSQRQEQKTNAEIAEARREKRPALSEPLAAKSGKSKTFNAEDAETRGTRRKREEEMNRRFARVAVVLAAFLAAAGCSSKEGVDDANAVECASHGPDPFRSVV